MLSNCVYIIWFSDLCRKACWNIDFRDYSLFHGPRECETYSVLLHLIIVKFQQARTCQVLHEQSWFSVLAFDLWLIASGLLGWSWMKTARRLTLRAIRLRKRPCTLCMIFSSWLFATAITNDWLKNILYSFFAKLDLENYIPKVTSKVNK